MKIKIGKIAVRGLLLVLTVFSLSTLCIAQEDVEGGKDNPYFSRMPNFYIGESEDKEFDAYKFFDGKRFITKEGKLYKNRYSLKEEAKKPSALQIRRNYSNAVKSLAGNIVFEGECTICESDSDSYRWPGGRGNVILTGKLTKGDKELWVEVATFDYSPEYHLTVLEKEAMKQDVTAGDMLAALNKDGFMALYINFDTGKYTIKPESQPIINEIVKLLKDNPDLKLSIEGHTDNVGSAKSNKILSEQRAKAVVDAVVKQGVDAKRLSSVGWGLEKPIADNRSEEGKAKNRRVEIVKK